MTATKELSVEDKLRAIYDLQLIDSRIDEIRNVRGELPLEVEDLEDEVAGLSTRSEKIKKELEKNGIIAEIGKKEDTPVGFDFIVQYYDTWRWDFKKILDKLEIVFITAEGDKVIAKSTYNIYKNKEMHNFPTPEKEVPKMIKELLAK